jgi:hypothetical protein
VTISSIVPGFCISCFDDEQIDIELQKRGKGGVITIWPQKFSHKIKKLEKEERFVVIEVLADKHKMILKVEARKYSLDSINYIAM